MTMSPDFLKKLGWTVLPVMGKRSQVRLECPVCKSVTEPVPKLTPVGRRTRPDFYNADGNRDGNSFHPAHVLMHKTRNHQGFPNDTLRSVLDLAWAFGNLKALGDPADLRLVLRTLGAVLRDYAPFAADDLESL